MELSGSRREAMEFLTEYLCRSTMENFGITVPEFELSDGASFLPVEFFVVEEGD